MNYRHAYHAGNHADVFKHIVLTRVVEYLKQKDKPFAALDAHAGIGRYDLKGAEAVKTGEWMGGIGKLLAEPISEHVRPLILPYLEIVRSLNAEGVLRHYPGSPEVLARLLRPGDRMIFNELHPSDADELQSRYVSDPRVRVTRKDAAIAAKSELPFKEKRGLLLIDPAFEHPDEMARMERMIRHALQRMKNVVILAWYPLKSPADSQDFRTLFQSVPVAGTIAMELLVKEPFAQGGLAGSGIVVFNPPYMVAQELRPVVSFLASRLGLGNWGRGDVSVLTPPR